MMARTFTPLQLALGTSLALHAGVLTLHFTDPQALQRAFRDTPLEVILVNAHSKEAPQQARAIAQATLAGGGDAASGRATSPLPPTEMNDPGDASEQAQATRLQSLAEQQTLMLAQVRDALATMAPASPGAAAAPQDLLEREEKRKQLAKLLAEIERRINSENERPKKRYISPATQERAEAAYYDALRRAIEERGTEDFPTQGGHKLYGELTMIVTVNHDGTVLGTEVVVSSGNKALDRRAAAIARSAGPFGNFSRAMRQRADQIVVVSRFRFTRDETLEARVNAQP